MCADEIVQKVARIWAPRFTANGVDPNDLVATTAAVGPKGDGRGAPATRRLDAGATRTVFLEAGRCGGHRRRQVSDNEEQGGG